MGYADGFYYGQGRIICDTSSFSVGDTIRVRSMTDSSKVWNKQVATVGTALVFTVPPYDYYKICTVQDISGTPTEIGGVYKTVDYGQTYFIDNLNKSSFSGIQAILNENREQSVLNIGDEVKTKISGSDYTFVVAGIDLYGSDVILVSKYILDTSTPINDRSYASRTVLQSTLTTFLSNMQESDRLLVKTKKVASSYANSGAGVVTGYYSVWLPTRAEMFGDNNYELNQGNKQFPLFVQQSRRILTTSGGTISTYMLASYSQGSTSGGITDYVKTDGTLGNTTSSLYILPCVRLEADS